MATRPPRSVESVLLTVGEVLLIPGVAYLGAMCGELVGCKLVQRSCVDLQALPWLLLGLLAGFVGAIAWCVVSWRWGERLRRRGTVDAVLVAAIVLPFLLMRLL